MDETVAVAMRAPQNRCGILPRRGRCTLRSKLALTAICAFAAFLFPAHPEQLPSPQAGRTTATVEKPATQKSWFQRRFARPTWGELLAACATPRDVCTMVQRYVSSKTESVDRWSGAEETWQKGRGDCEDFAVLIEQLCTALGFDATIQLYFPIKRFGEGHAVVVGRWNGQMWVSSLGSYEEVKTPDDVQKKVARVIGCSAKNLWCKPLERSDVQRFLERDHTARGTAERLPATGANGN